MQSRYKTIFLCTILILIFTVNVNFVISADSTGSTTSTTTTTSSETDANLIDIGKSLGYKEGKIFGEGIDVSSKGILSFLNEKSRIIFNKGEDNQIILSDGKDVQIATNVNQITFMGKDSKINVNGNKFENIVPNSKDNPAYIDFNSNAGDVSRASFKTSAASEYTINGVSFSTESGSVVDYNNAKQSVLVLENSKIKNVVKPISIEGTNVEVSSGYNLREGDLNFDGKGNSFIRGNQKANINGVYSKTFSTNSENSLYFGFDKNVDPTKDSLVFTKDKLTLSSNEDIYTCAVMFDRNNPYVNMEEGDAFNIFPAKDSKIELDSRSGTELIPKLNILTGNADITEDGKTISFEDGMFGMSKNDYPETSTTSPVEILYKSKMPGYTDSKMMVDNFNRMAMIPNNEEEYFADYEGLDVKFSAKLEYNYLDENNIDNLLGKPVTFDLKFSELTTGGVKQMVLGRLRDYWNVITPEEQNAVKEIEISTAEVNTAGKVAEAYALGGVNKIVFKESSDSYNLDTFRHEVSHLRTFEISEDMLGDKYDSIKQERDAVLKQILEMSESSQMSYSQRREYNSLIKDYSSLYNQMSSIEQNSNVGIVGEWLGVSGQYDKSKDTKDGYTVYTGDFKDVYAGEAAGGYVRAYGAKNINEDIATFNEKISDPAFFKPLLSADNPYSSVYRAKLDLLYEYKYISWGEYQAILNAAK
jgi:hypothetical protein